LSRISGNTFHQISSIPNSEWRMPKILVKGRMHSFSVFCIGPTSTCVPRKLKPQNICRPLQKLYPGIPTQTFVFGVFELQYSFFRVIPSQTGVDHPQNQPMHAPERERARRAPPAQHPGVHAVPSPAGPTDAVMPLIPPTPNRHPSPTVFLRTYPLLWEGKQKPLLCNSNLNV
jgi:hypothetical protein